MKQLALAAALTCFAGVAAATPISLYYDVADIGGGSYQYDFEMILDNNDGSHTAGDGYEWFSIGSGFTPDGQNITSPFSEGRDFFTVLPDGFGATFASGGFDGPTLFFGADLNTPYWQPNVGDSVSFTGVSSTLVEEGELYFAILRSSGNNPSRSRAFAANPDFTVSEVPLPAGLPLLALALAAVGGLARRRAA